MKLVTVLAVLILAEVATANVPPPPMVLAPCVRVMQLEKAQPDYKFYSLRLHIKGAELAPLELTTEKWTELPIRVEKTESAVAVYCVLAADVKKFDKPVDLLAAIKAGTVKVGTLELPARVSISRNEPPGEQQVRHTLIVGEQGKLSHKQVIEPAKLPKGEKEPQPTASPRKAPLVSGAFAALTLGALGMWALRRK